MNVSGADLLAKVHGAAGLDMHHRIPYAMDASDVLRTAETVHKLVRTGRLPNYDALWGGTFIEFEKWVSRWVAFLEQCGGYDTAPPWECSNEPDWSVPT